MDTQTVHPAWLRAMHWINALAVLLMVMSGWSVYNATGFLGFEIPHALTLGGWLGGALLWHFAAMWLLVINGLAYLLVNALSLRLFRRFFPLSVGGLLTDLRAALHGRLAHDDPQHYNMPQKLAYLFVMLDSVLLVLSGLVLWKSVQFPLLRELLGGYEASRYIHFAAMAALLGFVVVHLLMVALVPRTLLHMLRGQ